MKWRKQCCKCFKTFYDGNYTKRYEVDEDTFDFEYGCDGYYVEVEHCPYCGSEEFIIV